MQSLETKSSRPRPKSFETETRPETFETESETPKNGALDTSRDSITAFQSSSDIQNWIYKFGTPSVVQF